MLGVLVEVLKLLLLDFGRAMIEKYIRAKEKVKAHREKRRADREKPK